MEDSKRAEVREIAFEVADTIKADLKEWAGTQIKLHLAECPVKAAVTAAANQGRGAARVIAVLAGAIGAAIMALVNHFWK